MSDYDLNSIKRHSFITRFGTTVIGPLIEEPEFEFERSVEESTIYENEGDEPVAAYIQKMAKMSFAKSCKG